ncbi:MAG: glycosyltransferase family 4 protein, partial [Lachnospiraceae bacterium]|nr:glycosyltransferase family 4 protein [Lachnospiraceae bacterium]
KLYRKLKDTHAYKKQWLTSSLLEKLRAEDFSIVYTNTSTVDAGAKIAEALNIPHVWHIREFGKEDFELIPISPFDVYQQTFQKAKKIIVISEALKEKYVAYVDEDKLTRIYNGFEIEKLLCAPSEHDLSKRMNILVTGQVCPGKGQEQAIRAVAKLYSEGYLVHLYIAGEVDHSYLDPILAEYSNHSKWLSVLGIVKDMYALRKSMDIELVCSRSEAFGRVTLEAMLHSIPVIGSRAGGTPELINDHETGLLFEYGNIDELVACIKGLCSNPDVYDSIVKNAREYASEFTIQKTADQVFSVLKSIGSDENE